MFNNSLITREEKRFSLITGRYELFQTRFALGGEKKSEKVYTPGFRNSRFNYSTLLSTIRFYFYKSDHGNLIGRQELVTETAHCGSRRCRWCAASAPDPSFPWPPPSLPSPPFHPSTLVPSCLLFHDGGSEFSQLRERPSRLFVIREAAGEISRRSAGSERNPISTFFRPSYDVLTNLRARSRAPFLPDSPRGTRK